MTVLSLIARISRRLAVLAVVLSAVSADAASYKFTNIADSSGEYRGFDEPLINDQGVCGFSAASDTGSYLDSIHTWDDGKFSTLYDTQEFPRLYISSPVEINNAGTIAFLGRVESGQGIYTGDGGPLTTIVDRSGDFNPSGVLSFNDSGRVAFHSSLDDGSYGVFTGDGGPITTIAHTNQGFDNFRAPAINDLGAVAYLAESGDDSFIFYQEEGGPRTTLLQEFGDPWFELGTTMNNRGQVVVCTWHPSEVDPDVLDVTLSIVSSDGVTPLADNSGPFFFFYAEGSGINDNGDVAFVARFDDLSNGIFTGPDVAADRVVVEGDTLFGNTIEQLGFEGALNDRGQIAFWYRLDNGINGIALATPVPEPTALGLLAFGTIALGGLCARRRKHS